MSQTALSLEETESRFPEVFFLDPGMFKSSKILLPLNSTLHLDPCLLETLKSADFISEQHFNWAHM